MKLKWRKAEHPGFKELKERFSWNKDFIKLLNEGRLFPFQTPLHMYLIGKWQYLGYLDEKIMCGAIETGIDSDRKWEAFVGTNTKHFKSLKEAKLFCESQL